MAIRDVMIHMNDLSIDNQIIHKNSQCVYTRYHCLPLAQAIRHLPLDNFSLELRSNA